MANKRKPSRPPIAQRVALAEARAELAELALREERKLLAEARLAFRSDDGKPSASERARRMAKALGEIREDGRPRRRLDHEKAARAYAHLRSGLKLLGRDLELHRDLSRGQGFAGTADALSRAELSGANMVEVTDAPPPPAAALRLVAKWYGYSTVASCLRSLQSVRKRWREKAKRLDNDLLREICDLLADLPETRIVESPRPRAKK